MFGRFLGPAWGTTLRVRFVAGNHPTAVRFVARNHPSVCVADSSPQRGATANIRLDIGAP